MEASYICYLLKPDYNNYAKRLVKSPKLYFYDTGLACSLRYTIEGKQYAYEIKSGATYSSDFFKGISKWAKLSGATPEQCFALYNGDKDMKTSQGEVVNWNYR